MTETEPESAILLIGHGSRQQSSLIATEELRARLVAEMQTPVALAFLELAAPDIPTVLTSLADRGAARIVVQPLMLSYASHAVTDIPMALRQFAMERPEIEIVYGDAFAEDDAVVAVAAERLEAALSAINAERFSLLTVGRGASNHQANALAHWLNNRLAAMFSPEHSTIAFAGKTPPTVEDGLDELATLAPDLPVVVVPYLLFSGFVSGQIATAVREFKARHGLEVIMSDPLGPHCALVNMLKDRITALQSNPGPSIITP